MERRLVALAVITAGVWQYSVGAALITAGVLFGLSGVDVRTYADRSALATRRGWTRLRALATQLPRQTVAVTLVAVGLVALPVSMALLAGTWAGLAAVGGLVLAAGVALGWE